MQILLKSHFSTPDDMVSDKLLEKLIYLPFSDLSDDEESMGNVSILMRKPNNNKSFIRSHLSFLFFKKINLMSLFWLVGLMNFLKFKR